MAVGFANGKVLLLKGDITKEKYSKVVQLHSSSYPVTCLNWSKNLLFVTTTKDAQYYDVSARQPGRRHIDEKGCAPNCATVTESGELVLGKSGSKLLKNKYKKMVLSQSLQHFYAQKTFMPA